MLAMLLSNRAAAFVAAGAFSDGLLDAMATIRWRPDWVKGYFRKAEALWGLGQFSLALDAYEVAHAVDPTNRTIVDRIHRTRGRILDDATGLAIHQLFPGRDICKKSILAPVQNLVFDYAIRMRNFIYLVANTYSRECVVVDACWDVDGILSFAKSKGLRIVAAVVTHYHIDHVGGIPPAPFDSYGVRVDGLAKLLRKLPDIKAYAHHNDIDAIIKTNPEMTRDRFVPTENGSSLTLPLIEKGVPSLVERVAPDSLETTIGTHVTSFTFMHTPGHTPGSQCILVNGCRLFSGDTLFIGSCGRVDSPDSSSSDLYDSLQRTLAALPDSVLVYPGHDYGGEMTTIGEERQTGLLREIHRTVFMSQFDQ
nr:hypothetical protein HK105_005643 [Polyrhizophydium stewartii]